MFVSTRDWISADMLHLQLGKIIRLVPNLLTSLRVLLVPILVVLLIRPTPSSNIWAVMLFIAASVTDWIDGYIARAFNAHTVFGKLLDPLADKILVMAALVMMASASPVPRVPAWMVVLILSREMIVTGLRSLAAFYGVVVPASLLAKHKTFWMMAAIPLLLLNRPYDIFFCVIDCHKLGMVFLWAALLYSIISGIGYAARLCTLFKLKPDSELGDYA